jgi:hypothetical protein
LKSGFTGIEPWKTIVADDNPGEVATPDPILIVHSAADDLLPPVLSELLFNRLCRLHQVVERRVYDKGQDHGQAVPDAYQDGFEWLQARFAGEPAASTCPAS